MLVLLVISFLIIVLLEVPGLIQQKYWKELAVFGILLIIGFTLSLLMVMGVPLPHVTSMITQIFKTVFRLLGLSL